MDFAEDDAVREAVAIEAARWAELLRRLDDERFCAAVDAAPLRPLRPLRLP